MLGIGRGDKLLNHDFYCYNAANLVWNGAAFVVWEDANYLSYRVAATQQGTSGRFYATLPADTVRFELAERGASLALSDVVWFDGLKAGAREGLAGDWADEFGRKFTLEVTDP